jgi:hypothetical protein
MKNQEAFLLGSCCYLLKALRINLLTLQGGAATSINIMKHEPGKTSIPSFSGCSGRPGMVDAAAHEADFLDAARPP